MRRKLVKPDSPAPAGPPTLNTVDPWTLCSGNKFVIGQWRETAPGKATLQIIMTLIVRKSENDTITAGFTDGHPITSATITLSIAQLRGDINMGVVVAKAEDYWAWQEACNEYANGKG